uniref:Transcriptional regulator n=1 Tax=uncultured bacterium Contig783 TaxID=1393612 RepID=W0FIQ8_9BACT|nr:transcriptional regulator [uncultured bacterium Contig783]
MLLFFCVFFICQVKKRNDELAAEPGMTGSGQAVSSFETGGSFDSYSDIYEGEDEVEIVFYNGQAYRAKDDLETVLFLGIDTFGESETVSNQNNNGLQADTIMLFVIDNDEQEYSILQLDRGTMTRITVLGSLGDFVRYDTAQLCFAHTYGDGLLQSCRLTADAVQYLLLDTRIDHYLSLSMDSIAILNDQVGGVTVTIPEDMTEVDPAMEEGATITLQGSQAETFVRSRMALEDDSNLFRMERQRIYMQAWQELASRRVNEDGTFALQLITVLSDYMVSDMTAGELSDLADILSEYTPTGIYTLEGETVSGERWVEFYPDEESVRSTIMELFYEEYDLSGQA